MRRLSMLALGTVAAALATAVPAQAAATSWQATVPPLKPSSYLGDITAAGPADAWAVGVQAITYTGYSMEQPYALLHWNGSTWSERRLPGRVGLLYGISAAATGNVWTVGSDLQGVPYAAHLTGQTWQGYQPVGTSAQYTELRSVSARGQQAVLVGHDTYHALVVQWNGQQFSTVAVPGADQWNGQLLSVDTAADGAAFAAGEQNVDQDAYPSPMILQRIGGTWRKASVPHIVGGRLRDVWAHSATDAWAVGTIESDFSRDPLILHWNGTTWQQVPSPAPADGLSAVTGDAAGNLWISGSNKIPPYIEYPGSLFLRYTSGTWSVVYGPKVAANDPYLYALANVPGTSSFWGAGSVYDNRTGDTGVIERMTGTR